MFELIKKVLFNIGNPAFKLGKLTLKFFEILSIGFVNFLRLIKLSSWLYIVFSFILVGLTTFSVKIYREVLKGLPNVNQIFNPPKMSTKFLDRNGNLLYRFYENENRSWISLEKIPEPLIKATIAIEDKDFYKHRGISIKGLIKAITFNLKNNKGNSLRGGSTITQQLVKNVFLSGEKTVARKVKEAILTILVERKLSKNEILERYFNQVAYGGEAYGVQEAALKYFNKNVWEINMNEATFLAGLPAAPTSYSPFGSNPEFAYLRQKHVIEEMISAGFISKDVGKNLLKDKLKIERPSRNLEAPHFVFYVKEILDNKFGFEGLENQGLVVTTTLDLKTQKMAEVIVEEETAKIKKLNINNGASLVIDVKTGDILAMVGSKDYQATDIDGQYNVTTALRQPGSAIKPLNYLLALENGWSLASTINDSPITYQIKGQEPYSPKNYTGKYLGRVTLRTALASSLNVPSVKLLAENGVDNMISLAKKMGITSWDERQRYGLSLALGSGEVRMIELAEAYSIFANLGDKISVNPILRVDNYLGENIYIKEIETEKIIDSGLAFLINDALSDDEARTPIFGRNSKLKITNKTVAVKTGTTNNLKDNWAIGWTPSVLVATWVGNNNSEPMSWVASGVTGATPIWHQTITQLLENKPDEKWELPIGVYQAEVCGKKEYVANNGINEINCGFRTKVISKQ